MEKLNGKRAEEGADNAEENAWDMSEFLEGLTTTQEIATWSGEYRMTEQQFANYRKNVSSDNRWDEKYKKTVLACESDLMHDYGLLEKATKAAWSDGTIVNEYQMAEMQNLDAVRPEETIEAATGIFFEERMGAVFDEIEKNGDEEESEKDKVFAHQTWEKVLAYLESTGDYELLHDDYNAYQRKRQGAHNEMIRQLNGLNEMAEKYGCQRLTVRNFLTNDFVYSSKRDKARSLNR